MNQWDKTKSDTVLFLRKKIMKYYKILDHLRNASETDLNGPPISALQFIIRVFLKALVGDMASVFLLQFMNLVPRAIRPL